MTGGWRIKLIFETDKTRSENNHNFIPVQNKIVICILHTRQNNLIRKVVFIFSKIRMKYIENVSESRGLSASEMF